MSTESWKNWQYLSTRYRDIRDGKLYEIYGVWPSEGTRAEHYWHEISEVGDAIGEQHGPFAESGEAEMDLWSR